MKDTPTGSIKKTGRQIGRGFAQYLADLDYRKSRIDNSVRKKINSLPDYRSVTCVEFFMFYYASSFVYLIFSLTLFIKYTDNLIGIIL